MADRRIEIPYYPGNPGEEGFFQAFRGTYHRPNPFYLELRDPQDYSKWLRIALFQVTYESLEPGEFLFEGGLVQENGDFDETLIHGFYNTNKREGWYSIAIIEPES